MSSTQNLKGKILKGGISLTVRQLLVTVLSLINVLVVARMLGPELYGIVAIALGIFYFLAWTSKLGLHIYLVRQPDLDESTTEQVLSFYNTVGLGFCALLILCAPMFGWWTGQSEIVPIMRLLLLAVWMDMVAGVSLGMLQRNVQFAEVGFIDALSQLVNYVLAVVLVIGGWGYWGPVVATVIGFGVKMILACRYHPVRWRWRWHWKSMQPIVQYGLTYSSSNVIRNAKNLVVPILVSRIVGVSAAGIISIAIRFAQQLSILRLVIRDMSISVMAKLVESPAKVREAISRGMTYQTLVIAPFCAAFSCLSAWLVPILFGEEWLISTKIFPFVAFGLIISSIFDLHTSTLHAIGQNHQVIRLYMWYTGILWLVSAIALHQVGLWGYAIAEMAALPSFLVIHYSLSQTFGSPNYWNAFWLTVATALPLFGGIFLPPVWSVSLLIVSYSTLVILNANIRKIPLELMATIKSR